MRVFNINNNVILYWCIKSYSKHKEFKRYKATKEAKKIQSY